VASYERIERSDAIEISGAAFDLNCCADRQIRGSLTVKRANRFRAKHGAKGRIWTADQRLM